MTEPRFIAGIGCPECGAAIDVVEAPPRDSSTTRIARTTTGIRCSSCNTRYMLVTELIPR